MHSPDVLARAIANNLLRGDWRAEAMLERLQSLLGKRYRWLKPMVERVENHFGLQRRPRLLTLVAFLHSDRGMKRVLRKNTLEIRQWTLEADQMLPSNAAASWQLPAITSERELAQWLGINLAKLPWYADAKLLHTKEPTKYTGHYHQYLVYKKRPPARDATENSICPVTAATRHVNSWRLIEAPKKDLKSIQKSILYGILDSVPPHASCCGFRSGSSIVDYATPHIGKAVILKMDLQDFYPNIRFSKVFAIFASLGYPEAISRLLCQLSTTAAPLSLFQGSVSDESRN